MPAPVFETIAPDSPDAFFDRELSWLAFARRVLALVEDGDLPLLERLKFCGIMGMLHDEFFMKRVSSMKDAIRAGKQKRSLAGMSPEEQLAASRQETSYQVELLEHVVRDEIRPSLAVQGIPILDHGDLEERQKRLLRDYFSRSVLPILTPLAVDAEHPFPFISNDALNIGAWIPVERTGQERFIRVKVPDNRPRWVPLDGEGVVPLEQVIAANLDLVFAGTDPVDLVFFRVTRSAKGYLDAEAELSLEALREPGSIIRQVSSELKARRFAGVVRLQTSRSTDDEGVAWIARQLDCGARDVYPTESLLRLSDLLQFQAEGRDDLRLQKHSPVTHPKLRGLPPSPCAIFDVISEGDILLHHPYDSFDSSVLRFLESAAECPQVLAIKLTIYRTSKDSPIIRALTRAARAGKQVAVLVEITARFDEAPNIAWGKALESEGVHVAYGVRRLKTHVKAALVVREEHGGIRRYAHLGTGNYHTGTARIYEDLGLLTADPAICEEVASLYNELTGAVQSARYESLLVAPVTMRRRFTEMIRREAANAREGKESGISAKMNQLQDAAIIGELYRASQAGVPIDLNVRGLCCLRPGIPGLSDNIRVFALVGRFLEHGRIYRFANAGNPEYFIGSADWMRRNLDRRVESMVPVLDPDVRREIDQVLEVYAADNSSVWDCQPDGVYLRRRPARGEEPRPAQEVFIARAEEAAQDPLRETPATPDSQTVPIAADLL